MSNALVDNFDVYSSVLNYGNREDLNDGDEWASWEASLAGPDGFTERAVVEVYNEDGYRRRFLITWMEIVE